MKTKSNTETTTIPATKVTVLRAATLAAALVLISASSQGRDHDSDTRYAQENLVSDQAGVALVQDPDLVNAWGMSFSSGSPFWISDNATGKATLYAVTNDTSGNLHV